MAEQKAARNETLEWVNRLLVDYDADRLTVREFATEVDKRFGTEGRITGMPDRRTSATSIVNHVGEVLYHRLVRSGVDPKVIVEARQSTNDELDAWLQVVLGASAPDEDEHGAWDKESQRYADGCKSDEPLKMPEQIVSGKTLIDTMPLSQDIGIYEPVQKKVILEFWSDGAVTWRAPEGKSYVTDVLVGEKP